MKTLALILTAVLAGLAIQTASAQDVYVDGYYRSDGTYVRPHIRSAPDSYKWNNYGPSQSSRELMNPRTRNYDRDATPNYLDSDSDNDGLFDDYDPQPYGQSRW